MDLSIYDICDGDFCDRLVQTQSAIIPVGSLEQHGQHLPVSTDCLIAEHISIKVSQRLEYFMFPVVPYGVSFEHSPMFNVSVRDSTLSNILCDICISIAHLGIKKIVIINGHHGNMGVLQYVSQNTFEKMPRDSAVHVINYWSFMNQVFDHAGEVENPTLSRHPAPELKVLGVHELGVVAAEPAGDFRAEHHRRVSEAVPEVQGGEG